MENDIKLREYKVATITFLLLFGFITMLSIAFDKLLPILIFMGVMVVFLENLYLNEINYLQNGKTRK